MPNPPDTFGGKIVFNEDNHFIEFNISGGLIRGIVGGEIKLTDVESVNFNSDRTGWQNDSVASVKFDVFGKVKIPRTANNDKGNWTIRLKSGEFLWFNIDQWSFSGKSYVKTNDLISYGSYTESKIDFIKEGRVIIDFGSNVISGLMIHGVDPESISWIQWNSDRVGWNNSSHIRGVLQKNNQKNYFIILENMPNNDKGNFSVLLKNGNFVWFDISKWKYSTNAILDHNQGQIEYNLFL